MHTSEKQNQSKKNFIHFIIQNIQADQSIKVLQKKILISGV